MRASSIDTANTILKETFENDLTINGKTLLALTSQVEETWNRRHREEFGDEIWEDRNDGMGRTTPTLRGKFRTVNLQKKLKKFIGDSVGKAYVSSDPEVLTIVKEVVTNTAKPKTLKSFFKR